jgi:hypothetical protein
MLFIVDLRILITSLVSSNSSYTQTTMDSAKIKYEMAILKDWIEGNRQNGLGLCDSVLKMENSELK